MELIRGLHNLKACHRGCVASIGNYDGVHLGHLRVLGELNARGRELGVPSVVITFEPTPREFFQPDKAPPRLTRFREKWEALAAAGVDRLLVLRFDRRLAGMDPEDFIQRILLDGLAVRHLVVGDDFRFGHNRAGDFAMLCAAGHKEGFGVEAMPTVDLDGERVSSTRIRRALAAGDLELAARLLGRPYGISGRVVHGDKLGRQLGYPTVNIPVRPKAVPVTGIFLVRVHGEEGLSLDGVASLGTRPTVDGKRLLLEVYLLDFSGDLYGRRLRVEFVERLRDEQAFDGLDAL
ncbi:MAG: bifunctional riboflavin kinase/FAD synthetase, partial [Gammaproteobacteria bacterium]